MSDPLSEVVRLLRPRAAFANLISGKGSWALGPAFELRDARWHVHTTPWGSTQSFQYSRLLRSH